MNRPQRKKPSRKVIQATTQELYTKYMHATLALSHIHNAIGDTDMKLTQAEVVEVINNLVANQTNTEETETSDEQDTESN